MKKDNVEHLYTKDDLDRRIALAHELKATLKELKFQAEYGQYWKWSK